MLVEVLEERVIQLRGWIALGSLLQGPQRDAVSPTRTPSKLQGTCVESLPWRRISRHRAML
jgi:hypothetical protein